VQSIESAERADLQVSGVRLSVQRSGTGTPAVFLHGSAGVADWPPYLRAIAERYAVLVPDHPGFGESDDPDWIRTVDDVAMLYLDLFDTFPAPVHVIAHSLGGWIAAEMAIRNCTRMRSLTLIAPVGLRVKGVPIADNFIWSPEENARALFVNQALSERMIAAEPDEAQTDILIRNRFAAAKYGWQPRWYDPTLAHWLHRIRVPVQIIWGDGDKLVPPVYAQHWAEHIPGTRVTSIVQASHLPHIEQPDAVTNATLAFLGEHDA
jgi:pimeloyl-ACP methyl ester carboxylesterase